jgi:hypothetical protein
MKSKLIYFFLILSFPAMVLSECKELNGCITEFNELNTGDTSINSKQPCPNKLVDSNNDPSSKKEVKKTKTWQDDNWPYILGGVAMAPLALVLGTTIHEGSHALAATAFGARVTDFRVIPFKDKTNGYFYFGRMGYNYEGVEWPDTNQAWISAAPMFTDAAITTVCSSLAFSGTLPKNRWAKTGLTVFCLLPTVDLINHIKATSSNTDLVKLEKTIAANNPNISETGARFLTRVPMGITIAVGATATGFMLYDLFKKEDSSDEKKNKPIYDFKVAPSFSTDYTGLSLGFKF